MKYTKEKTQLVDLWNLILQDIRKRVNKQSFDTWFEPCRLYSLNQTEMLIEVPSLRFSEWLENHYIGLLREVSGNYIEHRPAITFRYPGNGGERKEGKEKEKEEKNENPPENAPVQPGRIMFNPKYTFDQFVIGPCNEFANAAAQAVAEKPGQCYNPLFIYGGVGLGKTHLMHAIGHHIMGGGNGNSVMYMSSENFMNDVIHSIRHDRMNEFRDRYRQSHVLLIDDIQFIAGKERTQEVFFHIFNSLYESQKQIVISSDKFPKDMTNIEERIRSRFEWGLIADIQPPDLETKIAILMKKAEIEKIPLPIDVAMIIAKRNRSNVRELEGALIRVGAFASLTGKKINAEFANEVLRGVLDDPAKLLTIEMIQKEVAKYFSLKISDLTSKTRARNLTFPRQIAMYLCREILQASLQEIGKKFGDKDHTTVIYATKKIAERKDKDPNLRKTLQVLEDKIRS